MTFVACKASRCIETDLEPLFCYLRSLNFEYQMPIHLLECPNPQHLMTPSFYDGAQESVDTQDVAQARYSAAAAATLQQMLAQQRPQEHSHWRGKQAHRIRESMQLLHI
jgi:hypothetical protein